MGCLWIPYMNTCEVPVGCLLILVRCLWIPVRCLWIYLCFKDEEYPLDLTLHVTCGTPKRLLSTKPYMRMRKRHGCLVDKLIAM